MSPEQRTPEQRRIAGELRKREMARQMARGQREDPRSIRKREGTVIAASEGPPPTADVMVGGGPLRARVIGALPAIGETVSVLWSGDEPFVITGGGRGVFIQEDQPTAPGPWLWVKTGLTDPDTGEPTAELWVEDGE